MNQMTDEHHNQLIGKISLLKGHVSSLRSKYALLRATEEYNDIERLADAIHTELLENYEQVETSPPPETT